jgi:hypothetical protein
LLAEFVSPKGEEECSVRSDVVSHKNHTFAAVTVRHSKYILCCDLLFGLKQLSHVALRYNDDFDWAFLCTTVNSTESANSLVLSSALPKSSMCDGAAILTGINCDVNCHLSDPV